MFVSGSLDKSLRLWDFRSPNCQGYINVMGRPVAAFDPEGLVLAAGVNSETLKLFDVRYIKLCVTIWFPSNYLYVILFLNLDHLIKDHL